MLDEAALARWLAAIDAAELAAFDTETTSLDPMQARIVGISLSVEPGRACYIPLGHRYAGAPDQLDRDATLARLAPWLADPSRKKLGQNLKYDQHALANDGLALRGVAHDTLLESYVLESHKPHDMDNLAWRHLDVEDDQLRRRDRQGRQPHPVRAGGDRARDRVCGRGRRHHAAPASTRCIRRIAADAKLDYIYAQHRDAGARGAVPHGAQRRADRRASCSRSQSRELGERVMALEQQAHQLAGSRSTWARPSSSARSSSSG